MHIIHIHQVTKGKANIIKSGRRALPEHRPGCGCRGTGLSDKITDKRSVVVTLIYGGTSFSLPATPASHVGFSIHILGETYVPLVLFSVFGIFQYSMYNHRIIIYF